jgi:hypothetical protein
MKAHMSWAEGRKQHRLNLTLADMRISKSVVCHYGKNLSRLIALAKTAYAEELYNKLTVEEKCHFLKLADSQLGITLRTILDTHSDKLRSQISRKKNEKYDILQALCTALSHKPVDDILTSDCYDALEKVIARVSPASEDEKDKLYNTCVELLKLMLDFCLSAGFCNKNPSKYLSKEVIQKNVVIKHLRAKSFMAAEFKRLLSHFAEHSLNDPRALGGLICLLQGLTISEVCGLRFGDIMRIVGCPEVNREALFGNGPYALKISRVYRCFDAEYRMTDLVESRYVYRQIPLGDFCLEHIRRRFEYILQMYNPDDIDKLPIISCFDNDMCNIRKTYRPDYLGKYIRHMLSDMEIKQADLLIPPPAKGSEEVRVIRMDARVTRLRQHFEHCLRFTAGMDQGEVCYFLGIKPLDVDSRFYIDYMDRMIQYKMKQKLDRWKPELIRNVAREGELLPHGGMTGICGTDWAARIRPDVNNEYAAFCMELTADPGQTLELDLRCLKAFNGTIIIEEVIDEN